MQGRVLHHDPADGDRLELGDRRERTGTADLHLDRLDYRCRLFRRKFVRNSPARIARDEAEPLLPVEAIDFVDHPVDVVIERAALRLDVVMKDEHRISRVAHLHQRVGLEAMRREPLDHPGLGRRGQLAHLAPAVGEKAERPRRGDGGIELAQRAGGRVARVGEHLPAFRLLPLVERQEGLLGHVDLAAHLADLGDVASPKLLRHVFKRADIGGDVFALGAVAARGRGDELAGLIAQRHREPVDLRFGAEIDPLVVAELEEAPDAADEIQHILFGKCVVERQHRHRVPNFLEFT